MKKMFGLVAACAASLVLSVSAAESCESADLIHRWSFNGSLADACGGNTARFDGAGCLWDDADHPTGVTLPGGSHGAGAIDLGYDCAPTDGGELTIEIFAQQNAVSNWGRIFEWGQDTANIFLMAWTEGSNFQSDHMQLTSGGTLLFANSGTLMPYTLGTPFHISMRVTQRPNGGLSVTIQKRDGLTGKLLATSDAGTDTPWPLSKLNQWKLFLGRAYKADNYDAAATYDEVRIWKKSFTDDQLAWSARLGADTLPTADGNVTTSTISASVVGSGSVAFAGAGTSVTLARTATSTLVATPAAGWLFRRWTGDIARLAAGTPTDSSVTVDGARSGELVAEFVSASEPITATWTGKAGNNNLAEAANWDCFNNAGDKLTGAIPTASTAVTIAGSLSFNVPAGTVFPYGSLSFGNCTLTADCDWRGLGAFTVDGKLDLAGHTLRVARLDGSGVITSPTMTEAAPAIVANSSVLWFDANDADSLEYDANGYLTRWTSRDPQHVIATASGASPIPATTLNGRLAIDFGVAGSKRDMVYPRFTNLRTVFWVVKIAKAEAAFLLGDVSNGAYRFHRGPQGQYGNPNHAKFESVWNGTTVVDWGAEFIPDDDYQVISATMSMDSSSDSLTNDRNISGRNGGRQLSELICFKTILSDEDRTAITQYLQRKWLTGEKLPTATLRLDVPEGTELVNDSLRISGNVKFVKEGAGTFVAACSGCDFLGGFESVAGTIKPGRIANQSPLGAQGTLLKYSAGATFDANGISNSTEYRTEFAGVHVCNTGTALDGAGPFGNTTVTADSTIEAARSLGFAGANVDLGGHTLDVSLPTANNYLCFNAVSTFAFRNGTIRTQGEGLLKIWSSMVAPDLDLDIGSGLWMCWTTTVHNLTFRYRGDTNFADGEGKGCFRVGGTFKPMSKTFLRTCLLDGSTLDLTGESGVWSVRSLMTMGCGSRNADHLLTFEPGATVTIDVHGRTLAKGERLVMWNVSPIDVTFQWDAATAALDGTVQPVVKEDGLYYGVESDPDFVATASWTGAAGDGDLANAANWACTNGLGNAVVDGVPGTRAEIRLAGDFAFNVPASAPRTYARVVIGDAQLTDDCDWRGLSASVECLGVFDLKGHTLRTAVFPEGAGEITSTYDLGAGAAPAVTSQACLWLDASDTSTMTIAADGTVTEWRSKNAGGATATAAATKPLWAPRAYGRPCVDFGAAGSKRDMTYPRFTTLRTVFWVMKIQKTSAAFLLGDINGGSGAYKFHRNDNGSYGFTQYCPFSSVWNGLTPIPEWSTTPIPDDDFQVISVTLSQDCPSDSLTNDRNITNGARTGGRQLQEIICFQRVLNDAERTEVTQYLMQKWRTPGVTGNLRLEVPADETAVNQNLTLSGALTLTKEGEGAYVAARKNQSYFGGNVILGGTATTVYSGKDSTVWDFSNSLAYGKMGGTEFRVGAGATFETQGNYDARNFHIVLEGGTLSNLGCPMNLKWGGFGVTDVLVDSSFVLGYQTTFYQNDAKGLVNLHGNALTFQMNGQDLYPYSVVFTNGTVRLDGNGRLMVTDACDWHTANLVTDGPLNMGAAVRIHDYTSASTDRNHAGSAALDVYGTFTPLTDNFYGCTLQDGAILCLTNRTTTFSTTSAFSPSRPTIEFLPETTITIDLRGRTLTTGEKLVAWTTPPPSTTVFQWDEASAAMATEQPQVGFDGLYYGGPIDQTVTDAVWTGEAGDGDVTKPANWTCRNAAGAVVEEGLPGTETVVHISGRVAIGFPAGVNFAYRSLDFGAIQLTADCDWRGLGAIATLGAIDLNGHKLYLSGIPATGTIDCTYNSTAVEAPAIVPSSARFWLDASDLSTLTLDANNKVTSWVSKDMNHVTATATSAPTYNTTSWARPTVDFGAAGSKLDMSYPRFTNLRTVFWVVKILKNGGVFLLGDMSSYHFHRGETGQYGNNAHHQMATVWNGTTPVDIGADYIPDNDFQVISATMKIDGCSDRLTNDRNINGRSGGRQLCELICFATTLGDADRTAITQYLQQKWHGSRHRGELHLDIPAGKTVFNNGVLIKNNVRVVKEGEGTYVGNCSSQTYTGGNEVMAGQVRPNKTGTQYVFGPFGSEMLLHDGTTFDSNGFNEYTVVTFVLDGGILRNTGADLKDSTALGKIILTADSRLEPVRTLSVWWDQHYIDMGGHTLTVPIGRDGRYFSIGANTTTLRNGTLDITSGGWFRVYHGALDASTVSLRANCAIEIADDTGGAVTFKDYTALYASNYNNGTNIIKVLGTFKPAAGQYFRGCELQNGASLDITEQAGVFSLASAFTGGAREMTFAPDATSIGVAFGGRRIPANRKIVDWTGRTPANLENMTFTLDPKAMSLGRRLRVQNDGLYLDSGMVLFVR